MAIYATAPCGNDGVKKYFNFNQNSKLKVETSVYLLLNLKINLF